MAEPYLTRVLAGVKTIESRFARVRAAPYDQVKRGDTIWLKRSGGPIVACVRVAEVHQYADLTPERVDALLAHWNDRLGLDQEFAARARGCRYATLIWLAELRILPTPILYSRRGQQGWVILEPGWLPGS